MSGVRQLEPDHDPPAPPRRDARNKLKPPTTFRVTARRTQTRRPRPGAIGDLDPDDAVPGGDRDRDHLPGAPEPLLRTLLPKPPLTSNTATSPHGCLRAEYSPANGLAACARPT